MNSDTQEASTHTSPIDLNQLIAEIAQRLMPASLSSGESISQTVLAYLSEYFDTSAAFYRHHDRENRLSILVAEWPTRENIPSPDPLATIPFDTNPISAVTENLKTPQMLAPGDPHTHLYQEMIAKTSGLEKVTAIWLPLISGNNTEGLLGLVREGNRTWREDEVFALQSIATMFMQTQSRLKAEHALRKVAYSDPLTHLPNGKGLLEHARRKIALGLSIAVIQIDLDELRTVNTTLGRHAGDELITQFASELHARGSHLGSCGRLNGNGFAIVLEHLGDENTLLRHANLLHESLCMPVQIAERHIALNLRIGISHSSGRQVVADTLFQEAESAIRCIDSSSSNAIALFDQTLAKRRREQIDLEIALRDAMDCEHQIIVHYQPEVDLRTGQLVGCEALVRWQHPSLGLLLAGRFIEMAEASGLVVPLSKKVLETAIAQQAQWMRDDPSLQTSMRINVSPAQFIGTDLAEDVMALLNKHALSPNSLCIEVTEHVVMDYSDHTMSTLTTLRERGVEVAIDDFGIGHSSIAKLKYMPADTLKIDRAFITSLLDTDRDKALVDTIIRMAMAFNMSVVAEGVETTEELAELLSMGADRAQGYLFAKPMPPEDVKLLFHQPLFDPFDYQAAPRQTAQHSSRTR